MINSIRFAAVGLTIGLVVALAACAPGDESPGGEAGANAETAVESSTPLECVVGQGAIASDASVSEWAGVYSVVMLSTGGDRADGTLTLADQAAELTTLIGPGGEVAANTHIPLYGWIDIDMSGVGAIVPGDPLSQDPEAPGVALLESRMGEQAPTILLRVGSEANQRGLVRFDGAFTVLRVTEIGPDGFRGRWNSGVQTDRAEGVFCAFSN